MWFIFLVLLEMFLFFKLKFLIVYHFRIRLSISILKVCWILIGTILNLRPSIVLYIEIQKIFYIDLVSYTLLISLNSPSSFFCRFHQIFYIDYHVIQKINSFSFLLFKTGCLLFLSDCTGHNFQYNVRRSLVLDLEKVFSLSSLSILA